MEARRDDGALLAQRVVIDASRRLRRFVCESHDAGRRDRLDLAGLLVVVADGLDGDGLDGDLTREILTDERREILRRGAVPCRGAVVLDLAEEGPADGAAEDAGLEVTGEVGGPAGRDRDLGDAFEDDARGVEGDRHFQSPVSGGVWEEVTGDLCPPGVPFSSEGGTGL